MEKNPIPIDKEIQELIPPLTAAEREQLESNILKDGCRDPLVTWNSTLLDGHHRSEICLKHKLDFRTMKIELADKTEAKIWVIRNQFGRRSITVFTRGELALKLEALFQEKAKENQRKHGGTAPGKKKNTSAKIGESVPIDAREEVAKAGRKPISQATSARKRPPGGERMLQAIKTPTAWTSCYPAAFLRLWPTKPRNRIAVEIRLCPDTGFWGSPRLFCTVTEAVGPAGGATTD